MLIITVDHNSDEIRVHDREETPNSEGAVFTRFRNTNECVKLLSEILNRIDNVHEVRLDEINEEVRSTKEEW